MGKTRLPRIRLFLFSEKLSNRPLSIGLSITLSFALALALAPALSFLPPAVVMLYRLLLFAQEASGPARPNTHTSTRNRISDTASIKKQ